MKFISMVTIIIFVASCAHNPGGRAVASQPVAPEGGQPSERTLASAVAITKYLNAKSLRIADLTGVEIINEEGYNQVARQVKLARPTKAIIEKLMEESGDEHLISRIYYSVKKGSPTIYVFITEKVNSPESSTFRINVVNHFASGTMALIDYDIVSAGSREMMVVNGPNGEETYKARVERSFFPF